ncbi:hypothetical protein COCCADRAFT_110065 [Bipolaris zeicola 26-R-13]|uniref:Uncharacterized protein n=1 Tax=Cochliobolus carbonum (strain 26-R-13) TaxID=930089 RepID=W6YAA7_COCC2|nr:uncharacterized protein COCCADRAFT_110065 [Bipolaris zeicola 26-R-13]EUC28091.1 hypothetical protein COCCADRAFT_110065 [Bipolaris zeicola 26-R-13]
MDSASQSLDQEDILLSCWGRLIVHLLVCIRIVLIAPSGSNVNTTRSLSKWHHAKSLEPDRVTLLTYHDP